MLALNEGSAHPALLQDCGKCVQTRALYFCATECCSGRVLWVGEWLSRRCVFNAFFFACVCVPCSCQRNCNQSVSLHPHGATGRTLSQICAYQQISILERCFHIFARPDKTNLQKTHFSYLPVLLIYK